MIEYDKTKKFNTILHVYSFFLEHIARSVFLSWVANTQFNHRAEQMVNTQLQVRVSRVGVHHLFSPAIKLGIHHSRKKERMCLRSAHHALSPMMKLGIRHPRAKCMVRVGKFSLQKWAKSHDDGSFILPHINRQVFVTKLAQGAAVDVDAGAPLQARTSGPPPSNAPGSLDIWVELTREQSKITPYVFRTTVVKLPAPTWPYVFDPFWCCSIIANPSDPLTSWVPRLHVTSPRLSQVTSPWLSIVIVLISRWNRVCSISHTAWQGWLDSKNIFDI